MERWSAVFPQPRDEADTGRGLGGARLPNRSKMLTKPLACSIGIVRLDIKARRAVGCRVAKRNRWFSGGAPHPQTRRPAARQAQRPSDISLTLRPSASTNTFRPFGRVRGQDIGNKRGQDIGNRWHTKSAWFALRGRILGWSRRRYLKDCLRLALLGSMRTFCIFGLEKDN